MHRKKETRRILAKGRREEDVKNYENLLNAKAPQTLYGTTYKSQDDWTKFIQRKLKLAKNDIEALNRV